LRTLPCKIKADVAVGKNGEQNKSYINIPQTGKAGGRYTMTN